MKAKIHLLLLLNTFVASLGFSQNKSLSAVKDTGFFNYAYWNGMVAKMHLSKAEGMQFINTQKEIYLHQLQNDDGHAHTSDEGLVWVKVQDGQDKPNQSSSSRKGYSQNAINAGPCTNIDFEAGTFAGWTRWNGWNPLTNAIGCCTITNGDQAIMTGAGNDPYGGFPVVYPGGGSFSARLGSTVTGGKADRIEQTFFVTASNANFTYRYAAVLNDGGAGHTTAQQPRFTSEIVDTLGNPIPCTFYQVSAGSGVTGYVTSSLTANGTPVIYKNWTNVAVDLTPNIGQNVTLRFTVYDCQPTGHFAYAYIDGLCTNFQTSTADTICPGASTFICAPAGFSLTTWNGPGGIVNDPNQCISVSVPGVYTCTTLLVPGCPGPTFTHTLTQLPPAIINVNPVNTGPCATQFTFNNTSAINSPYNIFQYKWDFGDSFSLTTTSPTTPVHNYPLPGTYQAAFSVFSEHNCETRLAFPVTIFPPPTVAFSPSTSCVNIVTQFTNNSTIGTGSISSYQWNFFGVAPNSTLTSPTVSYSAIGDYTVSLTATSSQGCVASKTQTLSIFPAPVVSFTANSLCDRNGTSFAPATSTAISTGSLTQFNWSFGDGGTSTLSIPTHTYSTPGFYNVVFTAISNHNCSATTSNTFQISPSPTVAFVTTSVNACTRNFTFTNISGISSGAISHTWDFGGGNTSTVTSPSYVFPSIGNYVVRLIGVSSLGCGDTAVQNISVYPYPQINVNVPVSCENAIITVSTTAVSGSVTSYAWNFGDPGSGAANTSTLQNPTHFYQSTTNTSITLNIVSNLNCPSSTVVPVVIFPNPVAILDHPPAPNCALTQVFSGSNSAVSNIGGSTITDYLWNFQSIGTNSAVTPGNVNYLSPGTYTTSMIVTTNHNCSDTAYNTLTIHPFPTLDFTVNSNCINAPTLPMGLSSITPIPGFPASLTSYTWDYGDNTFTNTAIPSSHTYTSAGTYTMFFGATSNMGCTTSRTNTFEVYPAPSSTIAMSSLCFSNATQFTSTNNVAPTSTVFLMNWDFGDGTTGSNGSNQMTSHTYSAPGSYPVTYSATTNHECTTILNQTVTIYPLPVVNFAVNGGCLNTVSQFTQNANVPGGSITSYSWNFGEPSSTTNTASLQNPPHTYGSHGTYIPTLTVVSDHTCSASGVNTIVIDPLPTIVFNPSGGCEGATIQFTNSSTIPLGTISSYTWNFGNSNSSNAQNPSQTYPAFGNYTVTLAATSNSGCVNSGAKTLTIHPLPQVTVTPVLNSCINDPAQLNTNILIPVGSVQAYTMTYGDGNTQTFTNVASTYTDTHVYTAYATYTINLNAVSDKGCATNTTTTIKVYPKPFVNFSASNFCHNGLTVFSNTSTIPAGYPIDEHLWNFNDNSATQTSTLSHPSHIFLGPNTYTTYQVSLTEFSYPEGTLSPVTCSLTGTKTITIFPIPAASFYADTVCMGNATPFQNTTPTVGVIGWSWSFLNNGVINSLGQNPSFTYTGTASSYTAQMIALNNYGCRDTAYSTVKIYQNPVTSFTTNNNCLNDPSIFFNNTTFPDGVPVSYLWSTGNTTITTNTDATHMFSSPGTYSVSLTANSSLGCSAKYTNTVTVYPLPQLAFNTLPTCFGQSMQFTNSSNGGNIVSYAWNFGDPISGLNNTSTLANPSHSYVSPGTYNTTLSAISDKNCTARISNTVIVHNLPHASFTNTVLCVGDNQSFMNLSNTTDGSITVNAWDFNGDNIVDQTTITPVYSYSVDGNYLVRLTVTTEYGCSDDTVRQVYANPKAQAIISADLRSGCPPLCSNFKNLSTISNGTYTTMWDFGDDSPPTPAANPSHCFDSGIYDIGLTLTTDIGCVTRYKHPSFISVYSMPVAGFKVDPEEIDEDEPIINVTSTASSDANFIKYYVSDGSSFGTSNFTHYVKNLKQTKPMVVQIVKNQNGCVDTISQVLNIKPAYVIYFPNVFTPNGDGTNDTFIPKGVGIIKFTMQIFDRWGHQVFRTNDITDTWDGTSKNGDDSIKEDTYTWKAQVTDIFNKNHFLVGHVTVLR